MAADSELIAADAIEKIAIDWELLPFNVDPLDIAPAGSAERALIGNVWAPGTPGPNGQPPAPR